MKKTRKIMSLALAAAMVLSLGFATPAKAAGTIVYQVDTLINSMDTTLSNDGGSCDVLSQVVEGLYTKDANGVPILAMASAVEKSDDGLKYTFTIRDDAKWTQTGSPVRAQDFEFAWKRNADPATGSSYQWFTETACLKNAAEITAGTKTADELGVKALDDKTLEVELATPCPIFEQLMTSLCFYPIEQAFFEKCGENFATSADTINCNGAFKITDYQVSGTTIRAEKNPDYYAADEVTLDSIEWQVIQDSQTAAMSYDNGTVDVVGLTGSLIETYKDDPAFMTRSDGYSWYIAPNFNVEGLDNKNIRLALAKSFDKEAICTGILKDGSEPADAVVPKGLAASGAGVDYREAAGADGYDEFKYDVAAAQKYWEDGLKELGKDSLTYTLVCDDPESCQLIAQFLQNQWQTNLPGLTIELKVEPKKARLDDMQKGNYDIGLTRWGPDYADPMTYLDIWESSSVTNYEKWSNADYDAVIASAKTGELALDPDARWEELVKLESVLADDVVLFPVYTQSKALMIAPEVKGIEYFTIGAQYFLKHATKE